MRHDGRVAIRVQVFVAETAPDASPRWMAHEEIEADGCSHVGEQLFSDRVDELIAWGRERSDIVYVRFVDSPMFWAGKGSEPTSDTTDPLDDPADSAGAWPPRPGSVWHDRM